jgi:hypothetical protein
MTKIQNSEGETYYDWRLVIGDLRLFGIWNLLRCQFSLKVFAQRRLE